LSDILDDRTDGNADVIRPITGGIRQITNASLRWFSRWLGSEPTLFQLDAGGGASAFPYIPSFQGLK